MNDQKSKDMRGPDWACYNFGETVILKSVIGKDENARATI
jgi:hypothetical protein